MDYDGMRIDIPVGRGGIITDTSPNDIPATHLIHANNIQCRDGVIEKDPGSRKWNNSAFATGIKALIDWFPENHLQRFVAILSSGKVYKMPDPETQIEVTGTAPLITDQFPVSIVNGGQEAPGSARKLFIFTGNSQIKVIEADEITHSNITSPSVDWTSTSYPRGGLIHRNRLWVFTDARVYASDDANHENFLSNSVQFPIGPGEGERISAMKIFRGRLFVSKIQTGVWMLVDDDVSSTNWYFTKIADEFGFAGPDSQVEIGGDLILMNSNGTLTSAQAVQEFGDVNGYDFLSIMKNASYFVPLMRQDNLFARKAIYFPLKKQAFFSFQSSGGIKPDRLIKFDYSGPRAEATLISKDQVNCFCLRKTAAGKIPFYGSDDGFIYEMDRNDRDIAGSAYTATFITPHLDFSHVDPGLKGVDKLFQGLQIQYIPTGNFNLTVKYYIDGRYVETITVPLDAGATLNDFTLNSDRLAGKTVFTKRKRLRGKGETISFEISNGGLRENFKITAIRVLCKPVTENDQKSPNSGRS
jgi:hypothetical protein